MWRTHTPTLEIQQCRLEEDVPVCSHRSRCRVLAFVLKGHHSVWTHMPGSRLDFIKCKLKKVLLKDKDHKSNEILHQKAKLSFDKITNTHLMVSYRVAERLYR